MSERRSTRDAVWAVGLFAGLLALYVVTLCPTVGVGDSGELTTAAATLGIPHPTGYPLYILAGHLFLFLVPVGEVAWRMNLFSAVAAAGTAPVFFLWLRKWGQPVPAALSAALAFCLTLSFWGEANIARVYSLNAL